MPKKLYEKHFSLVDDYVKHTDAYVLTLNDGFIKSRFTGFLSVNAVTVYELCIKEIFIEFSVNKNKVFGQFVTNSFHRVNGRIKLDDIKSMSANFGEKYSKKFKRLLNEEEEKCLRLGRGSIKSSYGNIIEWRHKFAHQGEIPANATYEEAKQAYLLGKKVIETLDISMKR
jgi:hypothetical protein